MSDKKSFDVVIIGGGFSGIMTAVNAVKNIHTVPEGYQANITIVEKNPFLTGPPYAMAGPEHLMYRTLKDFHAEAAVAASKEYIEPIRWVREMVEHGGDTGIWPGESGEDFPHLRSMGVEILQWPERWKGLKPKDIDPDTFICPRLVYGLYLYHKLENAIETAISNPRGRDICEQGINVKVIPNVSAQKPEDLDQTKATVPLSDGSVLNADVIIAGTGIMPTVQFDFTRNIEEDPHYVRELWATNALDKIRDLDPDTDIFVIGTLQSAMDAMVTRYDAVGLEGKGKIYLVSRSGHTHCPYHPESDFKMVHDLPGMTHQFMGSLKEEASRKFREHYADYGGKKDQISLEDALDVAKSLYMNATKPEEKGGLGISTEHYSQVIQAVLVYLMDDVREEDKDKVSGYSSLIHAFRIGIPATTGRIQWELEKAGKLEIVAAEITSMDSKDGNILVHMNDKNYKTERTVEAGLVVNAAARYKDISAVPESPLAQLEAEGILARHYAKKYSLDGGFRSSGGSKKAGLGFGHMLTKSIRLFGVGVPVSGSAMASFATLPPVIDSIPVLRQEAAILGEVIGRSATSYFTGKWASVLERQELDIKKFMGSEDFRSY